MKYIAYGSNMVQEQMAFRCPDARLIGTGEHRRSPAGVLPPCHRRKDRRPAQPGARSRWEINDRDERSLDRYEGYPSYYIKERWPVHMSDGSQIEGMIYIMKMIRQSPPHSAYYKGIEDAYRKLGLRSQINTILKPALKEACSGAALETTPGQYLPQGTHEYSRFPIRKAAFIVSGRLSNPRRVWPTFAPLAIRN